MTARAARATRATHRAPLNLSICSLCRERITHGDGYRQIRQVTTWNLLTNEMSVMNFFAHNDCLERTS